MKMSYVRVGPGSTIGQRSIVLYDSEMKAGAQLGNLSLLMKGETLAEGSMWEGSPAQPTSKLKISQVEPALPWIKNEGFPGGSKLERSPAQPIPKLMPISQIKPSLPRIKSESFAGGSKHIGGRASAVDAEAEADVTG